MYGNYIPGLYSGLSINALELDKEIDSTKYPIITTLYYSGVAGLYQIAKQKGFVGHNSYLNKCDLCLQITRFFVTQKNMNTQKLYPDSFNYNI